MRPVKSEVRRTERSVGECSMATPVTLGIAVFAWANWAVTGDMFALVGAVATTLLGALYGFAWWLGASCLRDHDRGLIDLEKWR